MPKQNNPQDSRNLSGDFGEVPDFQTANFDFDGWAQLARSDAAGYFRARRCAIESFIAAAPEHVAESLRQLQNTIDNVRACAGSPLVATSQISGLMRERLGLLADQFNQLRHETERLGVRFADPRSGP